MEIERTTFGTITIDGKIYKHDVIHLSGEVAANRIADQARPLSVAQDDLARPRREMHPSCNDLLITTFMRAFQADFSAPSPCSCTERISAIARLSGVSTPTSFASSTTPPESHRTSNRFPRCRS